MRSISSSGMVLLMLTMAGCDQPTTQGDDVDATQPPSHSSDQESSALAPEEVKLTIVDGQRYRSILKKYHGSVLLVDYWATWCPPCQEKFPQIVELHDVHAGEGLSVIGLSIDYPEDEPAVRAFLGSMSARFENLLSKFGASSESADAFDFDGGVPLYKLYDSAGRLRYQFGEFPDTLEHGEPIENINRRVEELLAEAATE